MSRTAIYIRTYISYLITFYTAKINNAISLNVKQEQEEAKTVIMDNNVNVDVQLFDQKTNQNLSSQLTRSQSNCNLNNGNDDKETKDSSSSNMEDTNKNAKLLTKNSFSHTNLASNTKLNPVEENFKVNFIHINSFFEQNTNLFYYI